MSVNSCMIHNKNYIIRSIPLACAVHGSVATRLRSNNSLHKLPGPTAVPRLLSTGAAVHKVPQARKLAIHLPGTSWSSVITVHTNAPWAAHDCKSPLENTESMFEMEWKGMKMYLCSKGTHYLCISHLLTNLESRVHWMSTFINMIYIYINICI